jgi:hypothetical protein
MGNLASTKQETEVAENNFNRSLFLELLLNSRTTSMPELGRDIKAFAEATSTTSLTLDFF